MLIRRDMTGVRRRMLAGVMLLLGMGLAGGQAVGALFGWQGVESGPLFAQGEHMASALTPLDTPMDTPSPTPICNPSWQTVTSPNPSATTNYLFAIAAVSANDVWAVGSYNLSTGGIRTLALHWDGSQWSQASSPNPNPNSSSGLNILLGVEANSANDVWAVGYTGGATGAYVTLVEHWDGNQWIVVPSPSIGTLDNYLYSISSISPTDVWAVGYYLENVGGQAFRRTLVEHYDGSQWTIITSPNIGSNLNQLNDISAIATNDVWAVGSYWDTSVQGLRALVEHWNGVQWSLVPSAHPPNALGSSFNGISGTFADDVWAVGSYGISSGVGNTLVEHWDGTQWSIVNSPNLGPRSNQLFDVSALSSSDVWAVGYYCCISTGPSVNLAMHWDGVQWSIVNTPNPGVYNNSLEGVAAISSTDVWTAGYKQSCTGGCPWTTLTEHYAPPSQCLITPTTTPTTTATPTITPTSQPLLVGHVNWQGRPAQPAILQQLPLTVTLKSGSTEANYPILTTGSDGLFTVTVGSLPDGTYTWRVDDTASAQHPPNYLANSGTVNLTGAPVTNAEMGLMRAGDANNDNILSAQDFTILKNTFGKAQGDPGYDERADFDGNTWVNAQDFTLLKVNFGMGGAPPIGPGVGLSASR